MAAPQNRPRDVPTELSRVASSVGSPPGMAGFQSVPTVSAVGPNSFLTLMMGDGASLISAKKCQKAPFIAAFGGRRTLSMVQIGVFAGN